MQLDNAVDIASRSTNTTQFWAKKEVSEDDGTVPEEWLDVDIKQGISNSDVETRRKRFGFNELSSEKENLFIKFLMFFTGPVLYGKSTSASHLYLTAIRIVLRLQWVEMLPCFVFLPTSSGRLTRARPVAESLGMHATC